MFLTVVLMFQVEGKHGGAGCFYVFENLTHEVDYMMHPEMPDWDADGSYPFQALPQTVDNKCGESPGYIASLVPS